MKFYRVRYKTGGGISAGYSWHTSKGDAQGAANRYARTNPEEEAPEVSEVYVIPTKAGILEALNCYADHPDNG
jgi:hypothetical protein